MIVENDVSDLTEIELEEVENTKSDILAAIQIITEAEIAKIPYDKTVKATIVDDTKWETCVYIVRSSEEEFKAYSKSSDERYYKDDIVYVHIPQHDLDNHRFIIGHESEIDEEDIYEYSFPFDNFIKLRELIHHEREEGYLANQPPDEEIVVEPLGTEPPAELVDPGELPDLVPAVVDEVDNNEASIETNDNDDNDNNNNNNNETIVEENDNVNESSEQQESLSEHIEEITRQIQLFIDAQDDELDNLSSDQYTADEYHNKEAEIVNKYSEKIDKLMAELELAKIEESEHGLVPRRTWHIDTYTDDGTKAVIGNKLGISFKVTTLLEEYHPIQGNYGLRLVLIGTPKTDDGELKVTESVRKEIIFDARSMYGNPYAYTWPTRQEIVYDISDFGRISQLSVYFWQDLEEDNLFLDQSGVPIPWKDKITPNIIISDLSIYTGFTTDDIKGNQLYLYTYDSDVYGQDPDHPSDRSNFDWKDMHIAMVHKNIDTGEYELLDTLDEFKNANAEIYWYRWDENYTIDSYSSFFRNEETQQYFMQPYHRYCGQFFAPMSEEHAPDSISTSSDKYYSDVDFSFMPNLEKTSYIFKVAVAIDGTHVVSNSLTFKNAIDVEAQKAQLSTNSKVILRVAQLLTAEDGTVTTLYPDDRFENFFVYDENNRVLCTDDTHKINYKAYHYDENTNRLVIEDTVLYGVNNTKYSDITYFLEIWIRDDDKKITSPFRGLDNYVRLSDWKDDQNIYEPFTVKWTFPPSAASQMNCYNITNDPTIDNGIDPLSTYFGARDSIHVTWGDSSEEYTQFDIDKLTTIAFNIKDSYSINNSQNTVSATIMRNGQTYTASRTFMFGKAMTQGCEYTPVINIYKVDGQVSNNSYLVANKPFVLECTIYDKYGNQLNNLEELNYDWHFLKSDNAPDNFILTNINFADVDNNPDASAVDLGTGLRYAKYTGNDFTDPFVATVTVSGLVPYDIHARRGMAVIQNADPDADPKFFDDVIVTCPNRVEFTSTGQAPIYYTGDFICEHTSIEDNQSGIDKTHFFPIWHLKVQNTLKHIVRLKPDNKKRAQYQIVPYDEPYDNTGNTRYYYLEGDLLEKMNTSIENGDETESSEVIINYGTEYLNYVQYDKNDDDVNHSDWQSKKEAQKLFKLVTLNYFAEYNSQGQLINNDQEVCEYSLVYGQDTGKLTSVEQTVQGSSGTFWQWKEDYWKNPDYLTILSFNYDNNIYKQAIAYDRHLYPSSLVNDWDGTSLTLDEEHGAILATMIATGTKDNANRFTGIMMGNWTAYGDESFDNNTTTRSNQSGIYGYQGGAISFAFLDDGTGYIGPAGAGRIQFDGRNALIANSDKTCYINLNPRERGGISPYFLFAKVPIEPSTIYLQKPIDESAFAWAKPFMEDTENNYFVVDPQHGVALSGGIISKYGKIGNWIITDNGLYQKYVSPNDPNNPNSGHDYLKDRFVYFGMPNFSKEKQGCKPEDFDININESLDGISVPTGNGISEDEQTFIRKLNKVCSSLDLNSNDDLNNLKGQKHGSEADIFVSTNPYRATALYYKKDLLINEIERYQALRGYIPPVEVTSSEIEYLLSQLYPYLKRNALQMDVYHYYSSWMAIEDGLQYLDKIQEVTRLSLQNDLDSTQKETFLNALYDRNNLFNEEWGLLRYENVNEYLHNHYDNNSTTPSTGINGTFSNLSYFLGLTNSTSSSNITRVYYYNPAISYTKYENSYHLWLTNPNDLPYDEKDFRSLYRAVNEPAVLSTNIQEDKIQYYTINNIGIPRVYSFDPRYWWDQKYINGTANEQSWFGISESNQSSSTGSLNYQLVPIKNGYLSEGAHWKPVVHEDDEDEVILHEFWDETNNTLKNASSPIIYYTLNHTKFNRTTLDLPYIRQVIHDLKIYNYYAEQLYAQVLFYMLEQGLQDTKHDNPENYNIAMNIVNSMGGLDEIKKIGLNHSVYTVAEETTTEYSEDMLRRMKAARDEGINNLYDAKAEEIKRKRAIALESVFTDFDNDKYAIYAGYTDPEDYDYSSPLFGVKWNGYMMARAGRIGTTSPWYISDLGLTQKNNSGIIFLGDPEFNGTDQYLEGNNNNYIKSAFTNENGELLPDDTFLANGNYIYMDFFTKDTTDNTDKWEERQRKIVRYYRTYSVRGDNYYTYYDGGEVLLEAADKVKPYVYVRKKPDEFGINHYYVFCGRNLDGTIGEWDIDDLYERDDNGALIYTEQETPQPIRIYQSRRYLGPGVFGENGKFSIYAGNSGKIHFGVRMDGTLFANQGTIGSWEITDTSLKAYNNFGVAVELNSAGYIDLANGNIRIDGTTANANIQLGTISENASVIINGFELHSQSRQSKLGSRSGRYTSNQYQYTNKFIWQDIRGGNGQSSPNTINLENNQYFIYNSADNIAQQLEYHQDQKEIYEEQLSHYGSQNQSIYKLREGIPPQGVGICIQASENSNNPGQLIWDDNYNDITYFIEEITQVDSTVIWFEKGSNRNSSYRDCNHTTAWFAAEDGLNYEVGEEIDENWLCYNNQYTLLSGSKGTIEVKIADLNSIQQLQALIANEEAIIYQLENQNGAQSTVLNAYPVNIDSWQYNFSLPYQSVQLSSQLYGNKLTILSPDIWSPDQEQELNKGTGICIFTGYEETEPPESGESTNPDIEKWSDEYEDLEGNTIPATYIDKSCNYVILSSKTSNNGYGYLDNWNLKGNSVIANMIQGEKIYQNGNLVATEDWCLNVLYDILDAKTVTVNNTANDAWKKAKQAADEAFAASQEAVVSISGSENTYGGVTGIVIKATKRNGSVINCITPWPVVASKSHKHIINLTPNAGTLRASSEGPDNTGGSNSTGASIFTMGQENISFDGKNISFSVTVCDKTATFSGTSSYLTKEEADTLYASINHSHGSSGGNSGSGNTGGDDSCFAIGTKILMADLTEKNIEDIVANELILSYDESTQTFVPKRTISGATKYYTSKLLILKFSDSTVLRLTPEHPLLTKQGWKSRDLTKTLKEHKIEASWLHESDEVISDNGIKKLIQMQEIHFTEPYGVYNLDIEDNHTYLAEHLIVHNADDKGSSVTG